MDVCTICTPWNTAGRQKKNQSREEKSKRPGSDLKSGSISHASLAEIATHYAVSSKQQANLISQFYPVNFFCPPLDPSPSALSPESCNHWAFVSSTSLWRLWQSWPNLRYLIAGFSQVFVASCGTELHGRMAEGCTHVRGTLAAFAQTGRTRSSVFGGGTKKIIWKWIGTCSCHLRYIHIHSTLCAMRLQRCKQRKQ